VGSAANVVLVLDGVLELLWFFFLFLCVAQFEGFFYEFEGDFQQFGNHA